MNEVYRDELRKVINSCDKFVLVVLKYPLKIYGYNLIGKNNLVKNEFIQQRVEFKERNQTAFKKLFQNDS
ncbi:hypothetical protein AAEX28_03030 [Lentisphaerota bacterium WC36G]|nr:hypothetical protein LJT99_05910 [Lentisphaerae bacterium WC36]